MEYSLFNPALSLLMKHLVFGQRQKATNFLAFHWSPHGSLVSISQHFVTTRVVLLPERTETSLITESDRSGPNHRIGPGSAGRAIAGLNYNVNKTTTETLTVWFPSSRRHVFIRKILSYTTVCPPVREDNPRALARGLSLAEAHKPR